jgi:flavorubredoxin
MAGETERRGKMNAIVLFDTLFGNTERIAQCIVTGLRKTGIEADCANIRETNVDELSKFDLIALGAPTQYFTASRPMKEFIDRLKQLNLKGKYGFAFDTRLDSFMAGSAAKYIEKKLKTYELEILKSRNSAIVEGQKAIKKEDARIGNARLEAGMCDLFEQVGKELGVLLLQQQQRKVQR